MAKKPFSKAGIDFKPQPDARLRECPTTQTLERLSKRFGEKPVNKRKDPQHSHRGSRRTL